MQGRGRSRGPLIAGYREVSLVDVIGSPSLTIWFSGCNLRCPWCQNAPIADGLNARELSLEELREVLEDVADFVEYVHVTGGEPTLQPEGLRLVLEEARRVGLPGSVSTNGTRPEVVLGLLDEGLISHVAVDVKASLDDPARYARVVGVDEVVGASVVASVRRLVEGVARRGDAVLEARTTMVPGLVDEGDAHRIASWLSSLRGRNVIYVLQQFYPAPTIRDERFRKLKPTDSEALRRLGAEIASAYGLTVYVRSYDQGTEKVG